MSQYNLIQNGFIAALTVSGTGNVALTTEELASIIDSNTTSSGVVLTTLETLFLEIDLTTRTTVDSIHIFMDVVGDRTTALSKISFWYADKEGDTFVETQKAVDMNSFFTINTPTLFAPQFVRIVIDGVEGSLYEVTVNNNDYEVAFGEDGSMTETVLSEYNDYQEIMLYSNSTSNEPVTAYVLPDLASGAIAKYIKLSTSPVGPFVGLTDGISVNNMSSEFPLGSGYFENTVISRSGAVTLASMKDYNILANPAPDYVAEVSIIDQPVNTGFGVAQTHMDWHTPGLLYAIGRNINSGSLGLYKLDVKKDKKWQYLFAAVPGTTADAMACMVCINDFIYVLANASGHFFRLNLNDVAAGWESLPNCPHGSISGKGIQGMCSDKSRYIYSSMITYSTSDTSLVRFDITTDTWDSLNSGYSVNNSTSYSYPCRMAMVYDLENDFIYMDCGESGYGTTLYQRYDVSTDYWNTSWKAGGTVQTRGRSMTYFYGVFAYCGYYYEKVLYIEDFLTQRVFGLKLPFTPVIDVPSSLFGFPLEDGAIGILVAGLSSNTVGFNSYVFVLGRYGNTIIGSYSTPIMDVGLIPETPCVFIESKAPINTSVSYSDSGPATSVQLRSSNTSPLNYAKMFLGRRTTTNLFYLVEVDLNSGAIDDYFGNLNVTTSYHTYHVIQRVMFDEQHGALMVYIKETYTTNTGMFLKYDIRTKTTLAQTAYDTKYVFNETRYFGLDGAGNIWFYGGLVLSKLPNSLATTEFSITGASNNDFVSSLSPDRHLVMCWYTDKVQNKLICLDSGGSELCAVSLSRPTFVSSAGPGECYVVDEGALKIFKFSSDGTELNSFPIQAHGVSSFSADVNPLDNILWIVDKNYRLLLLDAATGEYKSEYKIPSTVSMEAYRDGCVLTDANNKVTYIFDRRGDLVDTMSFGSYDGLSFVFSPVSKTYEELIATKTTYLHNYVDDPVWSKDVDNWREVTVGEFDIISKRYNQVKIKLSSSDPDVSPSVSEVILPVATKVTGLYPNSPKPIYAALDIPSEITNGIYDTKLKCWWTK